MNLILIRHGHADPKDNPNDPPLSDLGAAQSKHAAERIAKLSFDHVITSPLARAKKTCEAVTNISGQDFEVVDDLKEIYRVLVGGALKPNTRPNREIEDKERIDRAWDYIVSKVKEKGNVAVFCHGNVIRYFFSKALGSDPLLTWDHLELSYCGVTIINFEDKPKLVTVNAVDHTIDDLAHCLNGESQENIYLP